MAEGAVRRRWLESDVVKEFAKLSPRSNAHMIAGIVQRIAIGQYKSPRPRVVS